MSKSLGNLVRVSELLDRYDPDAIRLMLLGHHYREQWEYVDAAMDEGVTRLDRLLTAVAPRWQGSRAGGISQESADVLPGLGARPNADVDAADEPLAVVRSAREDFVAALEDDLNTPRALDVLDRLAESATASGSPAQVTALRELAGVLGLRLGAAEPENLSVQAQTAEA